MLVQIPKIVLLHPSKYLFDGQQYDFVGCILLNMGYEIQPKMKFPSELKLEIPPFTATVRRKIVDTSITLTILGLDYLPQKEAVGRINNLLAPHNIQVELI